MKKRFGHPWEHEDHRVRDVLKWKLRLGPREERGSWLGHSSFLLEGGGLRILVDPVFADFCAPFPLPGLRRLVPLPCGVGDIGPVDAVLLTHSHYDHMDLRA
ncbi:MAG: MBL fold metallo-hydrolase, partial [Akkermansiaceae bacterium]|nr:MBL fold metallo-hydrolase [Akkermansiaceae bacterium]